MQEMSITRSIVEICAIHAAGRRVTGVVLEIGELAGVAPESIGFCFDACSKGTPLEGAHLEVDMVPGLASCPVCDRQYPVDDLFAPCPDCGTFGLTVISGQELRVKEVHLE